MIARRAFLQGSTGLLGAALGLPTSRFAYAQTPPISIPGAFSAPGLAYASLFIADRKKLWAEQGVEPVLKQVEGGALAMVTLNSGDSDFVCVASTDAMIAWERGVKLQVVAAFYGSLTIQLTARREWLEKSGVSPTSTIDDKVRALKGVRIGSSSLGGGPPQYTRFLGSLYGLDPEKDIRITSVGQGPRASPRCARAASTWWSAARPRPIKSRSTDTASCSSTSPKFRSSSDFPFTVVAVKEELADKDPERVRTGGAHHRQGERLHPPQLRRGGRGAAGAVSADQSTSHQTLHGARLGMRCRAGARMTEAMWSNGYKCAAAMKSIKATPPLAEGGFWTNKFLS